ncbi:hypothetical protein [Sporosarcina sp. SAFN-010]|uniref:hypothetical protein n=1 Tax=Sporosarcina sp. SAFN-010 TaxID=3387273 RepID=UPI003F7D3DCF
MQEISLDELITNSVEYFLSSVYDEEDFFQEGTELEILSSEGKDHLKNSIVRMVNAKLIVAKEEARKLLLEREVISTLLKYIETKEGTRDNLNERKEKVQIEYQNRYKDVRKLETLLNYFG